MLNIYPGDYSQTPCTTKPVQHKKRGSGKVGVRTDRASIAPYQSHLSACRGNGSKEGDRAKEYVYVSEVDPVGK